MKSTIHFSSTLILFGIAAGAHGITQQLNSDEDASSAPIDSFKRPSYGPSSTLPQNQQVQFPTDSFKAPPPPPPSSLRDERKESVETEPEIDPSIPRNVRYTAAGYGGNSGTGYDAHGGTGYSSGGTNYGWTGTNPGYSSGGIVCTVCSNYDVVNAQRCCGFGYRQCCNVGVSVYNHRPVGGAGYNYLSKKIHCN